MVSGDEERSTSNETLAVFDRVSTPLTTSEVADQLSITRRDAYDRLQRAVARGELETRNVGARGRIWWRPPSTAVDREGPRLAGERDEQFVRYRTILETVEDGVYAVDADERFVFVNDAFCELVGWDHDELLGQQVTTLQNHEPSPSPATLAVELTAGERDEAHLVHELRTRGGEVIPVETRLRPVSLEDGLGRCGVVRDVTDRLDRERALERQRERLTAVNELHDVVRQITGVVVEQSTRGEIERTVCEALVESGPYRCAWIGEVDAANETIHGRAEAGSDGYTDGLELSIDPDEPTGRGPIGRTLQSRTVTVIDDVLEDPDFAPWRGRAIAHGFRSVAAVPIIHEGTLYGVLGIYAGRADAFAAEEQTVIGGLGELVGHAIAAVERKRALMTDDVVELEFRIRDYFETLELPTVPEGRFTLEEAVPTDDEEYLVYGTANAGDVPVLEAMVDQLPYWADVTVIEEMSATGAVRFEVRMSEPPVLSIVASHGGSGDRIVIEDGDLWMTIHVPQETDLRAVSDAIQETYPGADALARRQVSTSTGDLHGVDRAWIETLTDRQQTALEVAYFSGYFEWPRTSTGEDVADSLNVSPPTFHQHVRTAERKLFDALFERTATR